MDAIEVVNRREFLRPDMLQELAVWRVPVPLRRSVHYFKYRLALVANGVCVLRYDNEGGKGDHRHVGLTEAPFIFSGVRALFADFDADVASCIDENHSD